MANAQPTLQHASLGSIRGVRPEHHPDVEQYLGIQYATLANRFARGALVEKPAGPIEATKRGPLPVADPGNCDREHLLLQHALPRPEYEFSDTECLTLNVSVPSAGARATAAGPLPVVVLMHGGGFVTGSAHWPQYDLANLVARSEKVGSPVVAVGINYRLGPFGFLTSSALRDAGFKPNNGLDDQKLGLRWVQKHISGFGGDPSRVTYLGSSIGAASGFYHLQSPEPLFHQLVALGGSPLIQPIPEPVAEFAYGLATAALGLDKLAPADQVAALLRLPAAELSSRLATVPLPLQAVVDGDVVRATPTYGGLLAGAAAGGDSGVSLELEALFPGAAWCKTVVMGDCATDGMIMSVTALAHRTDNLAASLKKRLEAAFSDGDDDDERRIAAAVLEGYGIDEARGDAATADDKLPVIRFINDISFREPARATARAWAAAGPRLGTKAYLTHFNLPNPWEGPWRGHATHALDVAFLLGNYNDFLGAGQRASAERMASDLLALAYGGEPFPPYSGAQDGVATVYYADVDGERDGSYVAGEGDEGKTGRRNVLADVAAGDPLVLDKLLGVFGQLLQGPS